MLASALPVPWSFLTEARTGHQQNTLLWPAGPIFTLRCEAIINRNASHISTCSHGERRDVHSAVTRFGTHSHVIFGTLNTDTELHLLEEEVTLRLTVSQPLCLGIEAHCGTCDQILLPVGMLLSEICGLVSVGRPL
jgi:hypothetical protein